MIQYTSKTWAGIFLTLILPALFLSSSCTKQISDREMNALITSVVELSASQYKAMEASLPPDRLPRSLDAEGKLVTSPSKWWCSGFYPGTLWYLYEMTGDKELMEIAHRRTMLLEVEQYNKGTHDLGFMLNCSFGNGLRITGNAAYKPIMLTGAQSLMTRYNPGIGLIKSWDNPKWQYPVIIDNMMNLEFLFWAAEESGNQDFYNACVSHANRTMENHFRPDFSSFHLVEYDTLSGSVLKKQTVQGAGDETAWARGQSWGLYGFTVMYRATKDEKYLTQAQGIADFILNHPNLPEDKIPYWDFNATDIPAALRDASAAAVIASALIELSDYTTVDKAKLYLNTAKEILFTLGSEQYMAKPGSNGNFILKHSVGHLPAKSEVDVPLTYADYYFVEGLVRLKNKIQN
jgi:unsaturated chondroitin disaccharide hydrolase